MMCYVFPPSARATSSNSVTGILADPSPQSFTSCLPMATTNTPDHQLFAPPTTPPQHWLQAPSHRRQPHSNRLRCRKWGSRQKTRQPLRLRAPSPLRQPFLIRLRSRKMRLRKKTRHLHHRRPHPSHPLRLHGWRHTCSRPTRIG
jgi:hypothetical protein